jgi:methyl-accepting chemotaxis protein
MKRKNIFARSLQAKLILGIVLCLAVVGAVLITYSTVSTLNRAVENGKQGALAEGQNQAKYVKSQIEVALVAARTMAQTLAPIKAKEQPIALTRDQVNAMLNNVLATNPQFLGTYTLWEPNAFDGKDAEYVNKPAHDATGRFIPYWNRGGAGGAIQLDALLDYETPGIGDYYVIPRATKQEYIIDPYVYPIGGKDTLLTSLVVPIVVDRTFYGIAGVDLRVDFLQSIINQVNIYNHAGRVQLISNNGTIAASSGHPELVGKNISENTKNYQEILKIIHGGSELVTIEDNLIKVYTPIHFGETITPWTVEIIVPYAVITAVGVQDTIQMGVIAGGLILIVIVVIWFLIGKLAIEPLGVMTGGLANIQHGNLNRDIPQVVKDKIMVRDDELGEAGKRLRQTEIYLIQMAETAQKIAQGDLTVSITPQSDKDELGVAFHEMIKGLQTSVSQVAANAANLTAASGQLATNAVQASQSTSQIAATMQQLASGIGQQTSTVTKTSSAVEQMANTISSVSRGAVDQSQAVNRASEITARINNAAEQVTGNAKAVTQRSVEAAEAARRSGKTVEDTLTGMANIRSKVGISADRVREMGARSDQIGEIVSTIEDIASQTNLLALNAAIEAARAGEHGKGFAVVADEVRKLAERASSATKQIGGLIQAIQKTVTEAVRAMEDSAKEVETGVARANEAGKALGEILNAAEAVYKQAEEAGQKAETVQSAANELVHAIDSVSVVVQENTTATTQMSANSNDVRQSVELFASISEENSAAVEEVSASTEEMSAQVQEMTLSAESLAQMALQLQTVVDRFKLDEGAGAQPEAPTSAERANGLKKTSARSGVR